MDRLPTGCERLILVVNPRSTNADKIAPKIAKLEAAYADRIILHTIKQGSTSNSHWLQKTLRQGDIVMVCGGDGTHYTIINDLLHADMPKQLRRTPMVVVGSGHMNDLAHMLGGKYFNNPQYLLEYGRPLPVYPLECTITPLNDARTKQTYLAPYELGFGFSSEVSAVVDNPTVRAKMQKSPLSRAAVYMREGSKVIKNIQFFEISYQGKRQRILNLTIASGHLVGGVWRLPTRLSQREFSVVIGADKSLKTTVRTLAAPFIGATPDAQVVTAFDFVLHEPALAHFGGKPFTPPTPCTVHVTQAKEPIIMLATNPNA